MTFSYDKYNDKIVVEEVKPHYNEDVKITTIKGRCKKLRDYLLGLQVVEELKYY